MSFGCLSQNLLVSEEWTGESFFALVTDSGVSHLSTFYIFAYCSTITPFILVASNMIMLQLCLNPMPCNLDSGE